jgi:hypothetical protein
MCVEQGNTPRIAKQVFRYMPMNIKDETVEGDKISHDYTSVETYKFINNFHDTAANQALGTYGHRVITYNIFNKSYLTTDYNYHDEFPETKHTNEGPAITSSPVDFDNAAVSDYAESRVSLQPTTQFLHDEETGSFGTDVKNDGITEASRIAQRNMIMAGTTLQLVVKGQSFLESGDKIDFQLRSIDEKNEDGLDDPQYSGAYIITKIRHKVTQDDYVMVLECVKDSIKTPFEPVDTFTAEPLRDGPIIQDLAEEDQNNASYLDD